VKKVIHQAAFLMLVSIVLCIMPYRADANEKEPMTLFLECVYVDGVVSQEMIKSPSMTKKQLMKKYKNWRLLKETDQ
jgi:forespore regulator of the sigma-K checkpoint